MLIIKPLKLIYFRLLVFRSQITGYRTRLKFLFWEKLAMSLTDNFLFLFRIRYFAINPDIS